MVLWTKIFMVTQGFHLDKYKRPVKITSNQIDLAQFCPVILVENSPTQVFQEVGGKVFTMFSHICPQFALFSIQKHF